MCIHAGTRPVRIIIFLTLSDNSVGHDLIEHSQINSATEQPYTMFAQQMSDGRPL